MGSRFSSSTTQKPGVEVRRVWTWPDDLKLLAALQKAGGLESPTLAAMRQLGFEYADTADRVKVLAADGQRVLPLLEWIYGGVFGCWSGVLPIPSDNAFPMRRDFQIVVHNVNRVGAELSMAHYGKLLDFYEMTEPADDRSHPTPLTSCAFAQRAANTQEAAPVQYETAQPTRPPIRTLHVTSNSRSTLPNETQPLMRMAAAGDGRAREAATETKAGHRATSISSTLTCVVAGGRESDALANTNTSNAPSATTSTPHAMWTSEQPAIHDNANTPEDAKADGTRRRRHASSGTEDASEPQEKRRARSSDKEDAEEDDAQAE